MDKLILLDTNLETTGRKLYQNNPNYKSIANVMEHPEFRDFYDKYFSDVHSVKTIILFLKIYEGIEKNCPYKLSGYQKLAILDNCINDSDMRYTLIQKFHNNIEREVIKTKEYITNNINGN